MRDPPASITPSRLSRWGRILSARPRLWSSTLLGVAVYLALPLVWGGATATRVLLAWNAGALLYLALAVHMLWQSSARIVERRAAAQSEGSLLVLVMVVVASVAVLVAMASQLTAIKDMPGAQRAPHLLLVVLTVLSSWLFTQTLLALHYAHDFYAARRKGRPDPLTFPGTTEPGYGDFIYFACVIGTSGQTADVAFNGADLRPVGALHCILAFFFNTTVLALTVNIAAGLF